MKIAPALPVLAALFATLLPWAQPWGHTPGLAGQAPVERTVLTDEAREALVLFLNDTSTLRFNGRLRVPADSRIVGAVAVMGGPLVVVGRIEGPVVVINGDLRIEGQGVIDGDVTLIGGGIDFLREAGVTGSLVVYEDRLAYAVRGGEVRLRGSPRADRRGIYLGGSRITIRAGTNYNRVEGLPILFGPVLRTSGENPLQLEGLGIWRTEQGATRDNVGYRIRLEQQFGVPSRLTLGIGAHSEVAPIEDQGMRDLEASFTTFVLHRDYRDYFERQGFTLFATTRFGPSPFELRAEYRNEEHLSVQPAEPWTLRRRDVPWRPLPLIASGDLQTLGMELEYDGRNDADDPTDGWHLLGRVTRGLAGSIARPAATDAETGAPVARESFSPHFTSVLLDLRRYARVGPDADLSFRGVFGGALTGRLPTQFQHALGGEGSLAGYRPFSLDCGARSRTYTIERGGTRNVVPSYGCDRFALFQAEYRGHFSLDLGLSPDDDEQWESWDWYPAIDLSPSWAVFFEAGRGWSRIDGGIDTETAADVGVGVFLGQLGFYWAYPLTGDDRRVNFFVRLQRRF